MDRRNQKVLKREPKEMREPIVRLLQSGVLLRFDRTLDETLQHIVDTARVVIGARYAALAVVDEKGSFSRFFYSGLSKEEAEKIGAPPKGVGVLGLIIEEGKPLRLKDVTKHPKAAGFPPGHPIMRSFLGVPIMVNGKPFGRLYLAEKMDGQFFTKKDEEIALLLAAQAAATIERAMLTEEANRSERLALLSQIVAKLNRLNDEKKVLEAATEGIQSALPFAEVAAVLYRSDESLSLLCFPEQSRLGLQLRRPCLRIHRTPFLACMQNREPVSPSPLSVERAATPFERWLARRGFRSLVAVPLTLGEEFLGVIFAAAKEPDAFSRDDLNFLQTISEHVAVAFTNARLLQELREKERMRGLLLSKVVTAQEEERRRISHELHDQIGQLLTALLIQLQLLERDFAQPALHERLALLKQLAEEIATHLHHIAWELRPPALDELGLVAALERLSEEWSARFGIPCEFITRGVINGEIQPEVAIGVFRIVQEALTNVAKHAKATHARVVVQQQNSELVVTVEDNGVGFRLSDVLRHPDENRRLGLLGMMERAAMLSATLDIDSKPGKGTKVQVFLPLTKGWYRRLGVSSRSREQ